MTWQWTIHWATLDPVAGSERAGRRPVLVVSRDSISQALPVLAVVPLTSRRASGRVYATEVVLPEGTGGLPRESLVLGHQVRTLAKARLEGRIGQLESPELRRLVRDVLRLFLDL